MTRKRTIATMAALGGFTAAIALLSGLPAAKADELSDLRANQNLLQSRLDQLAQIPAPGAPYPAGPPGPTGVQMMGGSFPRSFLIPGTDTSIRVGGEIRAVAMYWITGGPAHAFSTNAGSTGTLNTIPLSHARDVVQLANQPAHVLLAGAQALAQGHNIFQLQANQSKINFETRTPTAWGEARTFMEFDWAGTPAASQRILAISDNLGARLRYAYGTLGGLLFGQANSNFSDSDAAMETISFGGLVGGPGHSRIPQVRYTMPLAGWGLPGALSVSAESPDTEIWTPTAGVYGTFPSTALNATSNSGTCLVTATTGGAATARTCTVTSALTNPLKTPAPDLTMAWYIPQPWGHMDFSLAVRPTLQVKDGLFVDRTFTGYGFHFSGDVKPRWFGWDSDYIAWNFSGGNGIGPFINVGSANNSIGLVSNYTADLAVNPVTAANILIKPVTSWGGTLSYQHRWAPNWRSSIGIGIYHEDINGLYSPATTNGGVCARAPAGTTPGNNRLTGGAGCALNKELVNAAVNLFWSPVAFVDFGLEYMYGHRVTVGDQRGDANTLLSRFRVRF